MRILTQNCPPPWKITHAATEETDIAIKEHIYECVQCRTLYDEERSLSTIAPVLSAQIPSQEHRRHIRKNLLKALGNVSSNTKDKTYSRFWIAAIASLFLILSINYWYPFSSKSPEVSPKHASVYANDDSEFSHEVLQGEERVQLKKGTLFVEIEPLQEKERFRILTDDSEIEVRGGQFEVIASYGKLLSVQVLEGSVIIRYLEKPQIVLQPGELWLPPLTKIPSSLPVEPVEPATLAAVPTIRTQEKKQPIITQQTLPVSEAETFFVDGFSAMRSKKFEEAANAFALAAAAPGNQMEEDALFWESIALARAGNQAKAQTRLEEFLQKFPNSLRAGEAALALAWIFVDKKDSDNAIYWFKNAAKDNSQKVRERANEALKHLEAATDKTPLLQK